MGKLSFVNLKKLKVMNWYKIFNFWNEMRFETCVYLIKFFLKFITIPILIFIRSAFLQY